MNALLGRIRACLGAWSGRSTDPGRCRTSGFTASGPPRWRLDGLSTNQARVPDRSTPAPVLGSGTQESRTSHLRGRRIAAHRRRAVIIKMYTSLSEKPYLRRRKLCLTGKELAGTAGTRSCRACALAFAQVAPREGRSGARKPMSAYACTGQPSRLGNPSVCQVGSGQHTERNLCALRHLSGRLRLRPMPGARSCTRLHGATPGSRLLPDAIRKCVVRQRLTDIDPKLPLLGRPGDRWDYASRYSAGPRLMSAEARSEKLTPASGVDPPIISGRGALDPGQMQCNPKRASDFSRLNRL